MSNIALLALTGFGNAVLRALLAADFKPRLLITRQESVSYPYYPEHDLASEAQDADIEVFFGSDGETLLAKECPEVILVCTYHRILRKPIFEHSRYAINLHPSLLPAYRGASPFYWVLRNGEPKTGITAHLLSEEADVGDIILQNEIIISPDDTQGSLRKQLSLLAGELAVNVMQLIMNGAFETHEQDASKASWYPRVDKRIREIDLAWNKDELERHLRALSPFPGALFQGRTIGLQDLEEVSREAMRVRG